MYQLVVQEEKQRSLSAISQINSNAVAFNVGEIVFSTNRAALATQQKTSHSNYILHQQRSYASNPSHTPGYNYNTGQNSHYSEYNSKGIQKSDRGQFFCDYYKVAGHTIQRCHKIHGYPPDHKLYKGRKLAAAVHAESLGVGSAQDMSSQATSVVPPLTS